jgi:glycosyltransferase involved in cell wall biosynthesis
MRFTSSNAPNDRRHAAAALPLLSPSVRSGVFIVIAAFNEEERIAETVDSLTGASLHVIVVDDGSSDETASAARECGATVLRHVVHRGERAALQSGVAHALMRGASYVITFDISGQHGIDVIPALLQPLIEGRAEVVLGTRSPTMEVRNPLLRRVLSPFRRFGCLRAFTRDAAEQFCANDDARLSSVEVPVRGHHHNHARFGGAIDSVLDRWFG